MSGSRGGWRLVLDGGVSLPLEARALSVGRAPECDVVLSDPEASKVHALLLAGREGATLYALGRNPTQVNGQKVQDRAALAPGDRLSLPGLEATVRRDQPDGANTACWVLERGDGQLFGLRGFPFSVGGGPDDDLRLQGLPPAALRLHLVQGAVLVEREREDASPELRDATEIEAAAPDQPLLVGGERLRLLCDVGSGLDTTQLVAEPALPDRAVLTFMSNGGELELGYGARTYRVYLAELRCRLVALLLAPPSGYARDELLPDDLLTCGIWPNSPDRDRTDLNILLHRVRGDLLRAGVNPVSVIERLRAGNGTRIRLAPGAKVEVR